jgi:hypothetical protein
MLVYVDDLLLAASSLGKVQEIKGAVMSRFDARDLGEAKTFLGFEITSQCRAWGNSICCGKIRDALEITASLQQCDNFSVCSGKVSTLRRALL